MSAPYRAKRVVDLMLLGLVALPAAIVGTVCAFAVALTSRGPVLFRQERVGLDGRTFRCHKFRTMVVGDNPLIPDATRITSVGRRLRRFSLDELPQLIDVARGDMSIVGPRPMLPFQAACCDTRQSRRHDVRPGLTGWAQVNGRNTLTWPERIELDLEYLEHQSPAFDVRILARTLRAVVSGEGVDGHAADDPFVRAATVMAGAPEGGAHA